MEYLGLSLDFKTASGECIQLIHSSIIFHDFCHYDMFKVIYSFLNFGGQDHVYLGERKKSFILDFGISENYGKEALGICHQEHKNLGKNLSELTLLKSGGSQEFIENI